jgi:hypothetical protein
MLHDIAGGALSIDQIATKHGVVDQTVYDIRKRHRPAIQKIYDNWTDKFTDLWAVQKHNRMADAVGDLDEVIGPH